MHCDCGERMWWANSGLTVMMDIVDLPLLERLKLANVAGPVWFCFECGRWQPVAPSGARRIL